MKNYSGERSEKLLNLSKVKQHMPYEVVRSVEDLNKTMPQQGDFASSLGIGRTMTDQEFEEFKVCWNTLREEKYGPDMTLKEYLCFYNALDVILLAEAHLSFRKLLYEQYKLSPDWFPTLPSFCYTAFLRMLQLSEKKVELIHCEDISNFVLRAKRGGLTQILGARLHGAPGCEDLMELLKPSFTQYARDGGILPEETGGEDNDVIGEADLGEARVCMENGDYFSSTLSADEVSSLTDGWGWRLLYIDANNCKSQIAQYFININLLTSPSLHLSVYGSAMTLPLPVGDYKFLENNSSEFQQLENFFSHMEKSHTTKIPQPEWSQHFPDSSRGYFLECDVYFPPERHSSMANFPPCPAQTRLEEENVSEHYRKAWHARNGEGHKMPASEKLCASLVDKKDIVLHSENALVYSRIGARIVVKRVLAFKQER